MDVEKITKALDVYRRTVEASLKAEQNVQSALNQLKTLAGGPTFALEDKYFQIRERNGTMYLCELKEKPKGRPKSNATLASTVTTVEVTEEVTNMVEAIQVNVRAFDIE